MGSVASAGALPPEQQAVPSAELSAKSLASATVLAPGQGAFSAEQLRTLEVQLQSRRVFRHLTLGNMPRRERDGWLLSDDGRELTLVCEQADPGFVALYEAESRCVRLRPGRAFTLTDSDSPRLDGRYAVTRVDHEGRAPELAAESKSGIYRNRFACVRGCGT